MEEKQRKENKTYVSFCGKSEPNKLIRVLVISRAILIFVIVRRIDYFARFQYEFIYIDRHIQSTNTWTHIQLKCQLFSSDSIQTCARTCSLLLQIISGIDNDSQPEKNAWNSNKQNCYR